MSSVKHKIYLKKFIFYQNTWTMWTREQNGNCPVCKECMYVFLYAGVCRLYISVESHGVALMEQWILPLWSFQNRDRFYFSSQQEHFFTGNGSNHLLLSEEHLQLIRFAGQFLEKPPKTIKHRICETCSLLYKSIELSVLYWHKNIGSLFS